MPTLIDWSTVSGASWPAGWTITDSVNGAMNAGNVQANAAVANRLSLDGSNGWNSNGAVSPNWVSSLALDKDFIEIQNMRYPQAGSLNHLVGVHTTTTLTTTADPIELHIDGTLNARQAANSWPLHAVDGLVPGDLYTVRFYRINTGFTADNVILMTLQGTDLPTETPAVASLFNFSGSLYIHFNQFTALTTPHMEFGNVITGNGGLFAGAPAAAVSTIFGGIHMAGA